MKFALIAIAALLVLGGGAAGAYFFFAKPAEASAGPVDEADAAHAAKAEKSEHGETGAYSDTMYVEMEPLVLPIIDETGVSQVVSLVLVLEVEGVTNAGDVRRMLPRLKDAYLQDMYGVLNKTAAMNGEGVLEVTKIKARLNAITARVMGEDKVNDVLLQVVQQRPI